MISMAGACAADDEGPYTAGAGDHSAVAAHGSADRNWMARTRFGMFIHFGLYSMPAGVWNGEEMGRNSYSEWIRTQWGWPRPDGGVPKDAYDTLLAAFNPRKFNAAE